MGFLSRCGVLRVSGCSGVLRRLTISGKTYLRRLRGARFARTAEDNAALRRNCSGGSLWPAQSYGLYFRLLACCSPTVEDSHESKASCSPPRGGGGELRGSKSRRRFLALAKLEQVRLCPRLIENVLRFLTLRRRGRPFPEIASAAGWVDACEYCSLLGLRGPPQAAARPSDSMLR